MDDYVTPPLGKRRVATAKYKAKMRTDEEVKHFDELVAEIEAKMKTLDAPEYDLTSDEYRYGLCQIVRDKRLAPYKLLDVICEHVIRPASDCLWTEGAPAPNIRRYQAHIKMKPGVMGKARQLYIMSKFNEARISYRIEEQIKEGKLREWTRDDPMPPMVTPVFIVERKGSLLGRMVGDYTCYNKATEDVCWPAPDAESVLQRAMGKSYHTTLDCVWGVKWRRE